MMLRQSNHRYRGCKVQAWCRQICGKKLFLDEANKKVGITMSHFSSLSDSLNLFVIVNRERKPFKCENEFSEANKRFGARLFVSAFVKKVFECQESFMVEDNCVQRGI